jgi:hypothetical protein
MKANQNVLKLFFVILILFGIDFFYANGQNSSFSGTDSLRNNTQNAGTTGTNFGQYAGNANTDSYGTFIGREAGRYNSTGINNTSLGYRSLMNNTTGGSNCAFGVQTLKNTINGNYNCAMGVNAMQLNTSGSENNAFGLSALQNNLLGMQNVAIGTAALQNVKGNRNTGIGNGSLKGTTSTSDSAANNTACGFNALFSISSGTANTGMGTDALC